MELLLHESQMVLYGGIQSRYIFRCIQDRKLIMALSRIDTTNMIEDVPQSKIDNNINFRNIIINGDMSIAQRGTSATGLTGSGYHTLIDVIS